MNHDRRGGWRRTDCRGRPTIDVVVGVGRALSLESASSLLLVAGRWWWRTKRDQTSPGWGRAPALECNRKNPIILPPRIESKIS